MSKTGLRKKRGYWMQTFTGKWIEPTDPDQIEIADIAHALSNLCRFGGHCNRFYSVAEHSLNVEHILAVMDLTIPVEARIAALLHDASETYLGDMIRPVKRQIKAVLNVWEPRITTKIMETFGVLPAYMKYKDQIKMVDNVALQAEMQALCGDMLDEVAFPRSFIHIITGIKFDVNYDNRQVEHLFLNRFWRLEKAKNQGHRIIG